ncbi:MAG: hypothetical protein J5542_13595, partial [Bacteroidales bacterium]|nr:hypothetical protein [Bacteroidales bacterium]
WTFFRLKLSLKLLLCLSSTVNFSIVDLFYFTVLVNKNGQPISGIDNVESLRATTVQFKSPMGFKV